MKTRNGFVSNSSSSSFVCQVSGEAFEVNDGCIWDADLCKCPNGHIFQVKYLVQWVPPVVSRMEMLAKLESITDSKRECATFQNMTDELLKQRFEKAFNRRDIDHGAVDINECPICTMTELPDSELLQYLLKEMKVTRREIMQRIRKECGNYQTFRRVINPQ